MLLALAAAGVLAVAFELASARHWDSTVQLVPWAALLVTAAALGLAAVRPDRRRLTAARALEARWSSRPR